MAEKRTDRASGERMDGLWTLEAQNEMGDPFVYEGPSIRPGERVVVARPSDTRAETVEALRDKARNLRAQAEANPKAIGYRMIADEFGRVANWVERGFGGSG